MADELMWDVVAERVVSHEDSLSAVPLTVHRVWIEGQPRWAAPALRPLYGDLPEESCVLQMRRADGGGVVRVLFDPDRVMVSRVEERDMAAIRGANAIRRRVTRVSGIDQNRPERAGTGEFEGTRPQTLLGRSQTGASTDTVLSASAVAEMMGLTGKRFRYFLREMNIVPVRVGKNYRFTDADVAVLKSLYCEWRPHSAA